MSRRQHTVLQLLIGCTVEAVLYLNAEAQTESKSEKVFSAASFLTERETWVAFSVLAFGIFMSVVGAYLLKFERIPPDDVIRFLALLVIVTGTLFLVAAGYSANDIAPALGLLGTVAGYLLGRESGVRRKKNDSKDSTDDQ